MTISPFRRENSFSHYPHTQALTQALFSWHPCAKFKRTQTPLETSQHITNGGRPRGERLLQTNDTSEYHSKCCRIPIEIEIRIVSSELLGCIFDVGIYALSPQNSMVFCFKVTPNNLAKHAWTSFGQSGLLHIHSLLSDLSSPHKMALTESCFTVIWQFLPRIVSTGWVLCIQSCFVNVSLFA